MYTTVMVVLWISMMASFPGYSNNGSLDDYYFWTDGTQMRIYKTQVTLWLLLILISTVITIFAIAKIMRTAQVL